jgi:hypothetical protein
LRQALISPPLKFVQTAQKLEVAQDALDKVTHRLLGRILDYDPNYWVTDFDLEETVSEVEQVA